VTDHQKRYIPEEMIEPVIRAAEEVASYSTDDCDDDYQEACEHLRTLLFEFRAAQKYSRRVQALTEGEKDG
jgi:hypothetical protein